MTPSMAAAGTLASVSANILKIISVVPRLLVVLAVAYFFYGLIVYASGHDEFWRPFGEKEKKEARDRIFYGILGLFVMVSVWGIVDLVRGILGI